jgi:hypothetical protein
MALPPIATTKRVGLLAQTHDVANCAKTFSSCFSRAKLRTKVRRFTKAVPKLLDFWHNRRFARFAAHDRLAPLPRRG